MQDLNVLSILSKQSVVLVGWFVFTRDGSISRVSSLAITKNSATATDVAVGAAVQVMGTRGKWPPAVNRKVAVAVAASQTLLSTADDRGCRLRHWRRQPAESCHLECTRRWAATRSGMSSASVRRSTRHSYRAGACQSRGSEADWRSGGRRPRAASPRLEPVGRCPGRRKLRTAANRGRKAQECSTLCVEKKESVPSSA